MPNLLAFAGAVFAAIAVLLGAASAEGNLVLYCAVQEEMRGRGSDCHRF